MARSGEGTSRRDLDYGRPSWRGDPADSRGSLSLKVQVAAANETGWIDNSEGRDELLTCIGVRSNTRLLELRQCQPTRCEVERWRSSVFVSRLSGNGQKLAIRDCRRKGGRCEREVRRNWSGPHFHWSRGSAITSLWIFPVLCGFPT